MKKLNDPGIIPVLAPLTEANYAIRELARKALGAIQDSQSIPSLISALDSAYL